jgi:ribosomal protein S18 acetylase RimI-like enzyme
VKRCFDMQIIQKIRQSAGQLKFRSFERILYKCGSINEHFTAADIRAVTPENVEDICSYEGRKNIKKYKNFLAKGNIGYYAYLDGICVHRTWIILGPGVVKSFSTYPRFRLKPNEAYIHSGETAPSARGNNIPAAVFFKASADLKGRIDYFYCLVDANNTASRRVQEKAGFAEFKRLKWFSFLWLNMFKELEENCMSN